MTSTRSLGQSRFFSELWAVLLLLLIAGFVLLWKLGAGSLAAWDEAIYAEVSKEILSGGDWLTLHWANQPWFEKPPLFMWLTAIFYRLLGISEFWARIPAALSGLILVVLTYSIGKRAYSWRVGMLAAVTLLTCYQFVSTARFGTMEVMLALFAYLAVYGYLRLKDDTPQWWYLIWPSCALAIMVKGAGASLLPPPFFWLCCLSAG
jgi:4-amino-4-deoxy-L-arabinose transferase-like glycosyltransferase